MQYEVVDAVAGMTSNTLICNLIDVVHLWVDVDKAVHWALLGYTGLWHPPGPLPELEAFLRRCMVGEEPRG
jgi:hypothetical protein